MPQNGQKNICTKGSEQLVQKRAVSRFWVLQVGQDMGISISLYIHILTADPLAEAIHPKLDFIH